MARFLIGVYFLLATASFVLADPQDDTKTLLIKLKDKDESVRLSAAKNLGKLGADAKDAIPALTVVASQDSDEDVRAVAKKALEAIRGAVGEQSKDNISDVLNPIIKDLKGKAPEKRIAALKKLEKLGKEAFDAGAHIVEFGLMADNPTIREAAISALENVDPDSYKFIVTILIDNNENNKMQAIRKLAALEKKAKSAVPALKAYYIQNISRIINDRRPTDSSVKPGPLAGGGGTFNNSLFAVLLLRSLVDIRPRIQV